jgi:ribosomal protein S18 acetylase RimI-like enzyme
MESPYQLYADVLTLDDRMDLVQFDCGPGKWAEAATEWIQGSGVWDSIENKKTRVWLYRNDAGVVVGYGSLGLTRRKWPPPVGQHGNLQIIPMLGVDHHFHGKPPDKQWRYSHQIVSHLRYEALRTLAEHISCGRNTLPLLTLYVHQDNAAAITLYQSFGFTPEPLARTNDHILMLQKLDIEDIA